MRKTMLLLLLAAVPAAAAPPLAPGEKPEPADMTMLQMRLASAVLESYRDMHGSLPDLGTKLVSASRVADALGPDLGEALPSRDGWGNGLKFFLDDGWLIVSVGADGKEDIPYAAVLAEDLSDDAFSTISDGGPARDIVMRDGRFVQRPPERILPSLQARVDLRSIGSAVESFAVDASVYPGSTDGLQTLDAVAADLEPTYVRTLPRVDPWGHPYLFWSDRTRYMILCTGADGVPDRDYMAAADPSAAFADRTGPSRDPNADVVFANGRFAPYPSRGEGE